MSLFLLYGVKMWFSTGGSGPKSGPQEVLCGLKVKKMLKMLKREQGQTQTWTKPSKAGLNRVYTIGLKG